jgi:hypothetical protein
VVCHPTLHPLPHLLYRVPPCLLLYLLWGSFPRSGAHCQHFHHRWNRTCAPRDRRPSRGPVPCNSCRPWDSAMRYKYVCMYVCRYFSR